MSFSWWVIMDNVVPIYNGILFICKETELAVNGWN